MITSSFGMFKLMAALTMKPLHRRFGVEIDNIDLSVIDRKRDFPAIRKAFDDHSLLLFRGQNLDQDAHLRLGRMFGSIENRESANLKADEDFKVPKVSNVRADGSVTGEMDLHTLNLKSNMLWHTDSTFLPVPALANIILAAAFEPTGV